MSTPSQIKDPGAVSVRPMREPDLAEARRIFRVAFGTFVGAPDPESFWADREYVFTRWHADPGGALVAEVKGSLAGSNFATRWGSFGFFGPLTVRPDLWDQHIAQKLLVPTMDLFEKWGLREAGLFTFAQSPKHIGLYQKFGFWPRFLTAIMSKSVTSREASWTKYSAVKESRRAEVLDASRKLTDSIFEGLDVTSEIWSVQEQDLGETVLMWGGSSLDAFAVCGLGAENNFDRLLDSCEMLAAERGLQRMEAGVNLGRCGAYRQMLQRGFRTDIQGVAMHKPDSAGFNRSDVYLVDDWR